MTYLELIMASRSPEELIALCRIAGVQADIPTRPLRMSKMSTEVVVRGDWHISFVDGVPIRVLYGTRADDPETCDSLTDEIDT
jgi:hypothetical protein